jgi:hypothetical protein
MIGTLSAGESAEAGLAYRCPKCQDTFDCITQDDAIRIVLHRALHLAAEQDRPLKRVWRGA